MRPLDPPAWFQAASDMVHSATGKSSLRQAQYAFALCAVLFAAGAAPGFWVPGSIVSPYGLMAVSVMPFVVAVLAILAASCPRMRPAFLTDAFRTALAGALAVAYATALSDYGYWLTVPASTLSVFASAMAVTFSIVGFQESRQSAAACECAFETGRLPPPPGPVWYVSLAVACTLAVPSACAAFSHWTLWGSASAAALWTMPLALLLSACRPRPPSWRRVRRASVDPALAAGVRI